MRKRQGFTLIELLVVISIIALLMGIMLPILGRVRKQAQAVACQAKLRQWGIGFEAYVGDHDGRMPGYTLEAPTWFASRYSWVLSLEAYTTHYEDMLLCPTASRRTTDKSAATPSQFVWWGHHELSMSHVFGSYGYNGWLAERPYRRLAGRTGSPVLFDCSSASVLPMHDHDPPEYEGHFERGLARGFITRVCINRHNGGNNMLFRDWSVRKIGIKENWILRWYREFNPAGPWTRAGGVQPEDWPEWMRGFKDY
ncbi:MAG: type II secretion system protein [Planctomycetes bacterium]|nr:type II secretion system protein [Planctomycetota bacterium]